MLNELYSFLPLVVAAALLGFVALAERKALKQRPLAESNKWNDFVR